MRKFDYAALRNRTWDNKILSYISQIQEYKGRQELFTRQKPAELKRLIEIAKIQSTESSNRIEGIVTTKSRLKQLIENKTAPQNLEEEEILGYHNALNLIHEKYTKFSVTPNYILHLHRELLRYTSLSYGGKFKTSPNKTETDLENDENTILLRPLEHDKIPEAIKKICQSYQVTLEKEIIHPLILIPYFILDFICIRPFNDENCRMSRLLTLLLLRRCGYLVGQYVSIEKAIADTKNSYYGELANSCSWWHQEKNDPMPFIKYLLAVILSCYREFEDRITIAERSGVRSTSYEIVKEFAQNKLGIFTKQDALIACPSLGSSSVESALKKLVEDGTLKRLGAGRNTHYVRANALS